MDGQDFDSFNDRFDNRSGSGPSPAKARVKKDGWHYKRRSKEQSLFLALWLNGEIIATVESFHQEGPWYAYAKETHTSRMNPSGPCISRLAATSWAELHSGFTTIKKASQ